MKWNIFGFFNEKNSSFQWKVQQQYFTTTGFYVNTIIEYPKNNSELFPKNEVFSEYFTDAIFKNSLPHNIPKSFFFVLLSGIKSSFLWTKQTKHWKKHPNKAHKFWERLAQL